MARTITTARAAATGRRNYSALTVAIFVLAFGANATAQTTTPLNFENNFLVTGDYVVAGVGLRGAGAGGYATGTITMPDANSVPGTGVPAGADIVGAFLYWQTVENSGTYSGQHGFFRALGYGAPAGGYPIWGNVLGNLNAPVSWSAGGCSGSSQGTKTIVTYRADVRAYLPTDANGILKVGNSANPVQYEVRLPDSGSNGGAVPLTLGASLVIIYRVTNQNLPLKYVVLYDGSYAPSNGGATMSQDIGGFYQAGHDANPDNSVPVPEVKITHIVGNGQANKFQSVTLGDQFGRATLLSLYTQNGTTLPPFPGYYNSTPGAIFNGSWDNPTWLANGYGNAVLANDAVVTTQVIPTASNSGCVSWGAVVLSTTVQDTDHDGLLDKWEDNVGYTDFATNQPVSLPNACSGDGSQPVSCASRTTTKDIYWQIDSMCGGTINADGSCTATATGDSHYPDPSMISAITGVFATHGITLHSPVVGSSIPETPACLSPGVDANGKLCASIGVPGVVAWKMGYEVLKNQPLNLNGDGTTWTETQCEANPSFCIRRFHNSKKDSYHEVILGHAQVVPRWSFADGSLTSISVDNSGKATFFTSRAPDLITGDTTGKDRVTVVGALVQAGWVGTFLVTNVSSFSPYGFTIQTTLPAGTYDKNSEPALAVYSGHVGTASGFSDVGGSDSLITLGTWGPDGLPASVQQGTIMHEFGHSLGLTHGGSYFDTNGSFVRTFDANCKPNFQSVMNYLFQVDLLDDGVLDYSEEAIGAIDETTGFSGFTSSFFQNTTWYTNTPPAFGTAATHYCDGSQLPALNPPSMYRVSSTTTALAWSGSQDINFDGKTSAISTPTSFGLRGYSDWGHLDLRQIGATGSLSVASGINLSGGSGINLSGGSGINLSGGSGINLSGGSGINLSGGSGVNLSGGSGINLSGGSGVGELDRTVANSTVRPPRNLAPTPNDTRTSHSVTLNWKAPTFGTIASYDAYRALNGSTPATPPYYPAQGSSLITTTSFQDPPPTFAALTDCTTYTYAVSSILALDGRESIPSNLAQYSVPCTPTALGAMQPQGTHQVVLNWTAPTEPPTATLGVHAYNVYRSTSNTLASGALPIASVTSTSGTVPTTFTDTTTSAGHTYYYWVTAVVAETTGCASTTTFCRESSATGPVSIFVQAQPSSVSITGIVANPKPPVLGQTITVNFKVDQSGATGTVTITEDSGATCQGTVSISGTGSCSLTLDVLSQTTGKSAVGLRTLTARYSGDDNFAPSTSDAFKQQVVYRFVGFLSPLTASGTYSGASTLGKALPIKWQLTNSAGTTYIPMNKVTLNGIGLPNFFLQAIYNGSPDSKGKCSVSLVSASAAKPPIPLLSPVNGVTGNSSFRYDASTNQYNFNWDTTYNSGTGCYTVMLLLDDIVQPAVLPQAANGYTSSTPVYTVSVQLK